jgi:hypothetical protein
VRCSGFVVVPIVCLLAAPAPADDVGLERLSEAEVKALFDGNTEEGVYWRDERDTGKTWKAFYAADGTFRKVSQKGAKTDGVWFVDPIGRHCFRGEKKQTTKCDVILRDGDHYLRVRDEERRGRIRIEKGNPGNL